MERLLKAREISDLTGVSRTAIYRMMETGVLPVVRFGERAVRVPQSAVEAWIDSHVQSVRREGSGDGQAASEGESNR